MTGNTRTPDSVKQAIADLAQNQRKSAKQIAAILGMTRNAVIGLCRRNDIKLPGAAPARPTKPAVARAPQPAPRQPSGTCCWIDGDPRKPGWSYCGAPVTHAGSAWCAAHRKRVYVKRADRTPEQPTATAAERVIGRRAAG